MAAINDHPMEQLSDLPCDGDGICMVCKQKPEEADTLSCKTCVAPWHVVCLTTRPKTLAEATNWDCPDCSDLGAGAGVSKPAASDGGLLEKIHAIEADASLTDKEKAKRRQELLSGVSGADKGKGKEVATNASGSGSGSGSRSRSDNVLGVFLDRFNCSICMHLLERPVSTPCGHNFCLKCFQKWTRQQRMKNCPICRKGIPIKMAREPRINATIVLAIRMAKSSTPNYAPGNSRIYHYMHNQDRPDKAFTTERAKKSGKANASSGKIFVTCPTDYFGPITAEYDPTRNTGTLVGEIYEDRFEARQWGAHFPHVAGIGGQSTHGAQSVALSGGYEDDEDHGEWFLYTGSGGRDLKGNKRTNKKQSSDQIFKSSNEALRLSCREGYPVRVVRSHKEKRSSYAPDKGVRYDGVYRIEKCWRKPGIQKFLVCRYLFVRCDNEAAPWLTDNQGDRPRPLPKVSELKQAIDITERKKSPAWDYNEEEGRWTWTRPQPPSRQPVSDDLNDDERREMKRKYRKANKGTAMSLKEKLLKEFSCLICRQVMVQPLTTPCAHNFCKACLEGAFAGKSHIQERKHGGRTLRARKNVMKCPSCTYDIADFLQNTQVNRELMNVIETLQNEIEEENRSKKAKVAEEEDDDEEEEDEEEEDEEDEEEDESEEMDILEDADSTGEQAEAAAENKESDVNAEIPKVEEKSDVNAEIPKVEEKSDVNAEIPKVDEKCNVNAEILEAEKNGDSMDEQSDSAAEDKENRDVNSEMKKVEKTDAPLKDTKAEGKKPCNDGGAEVQTVKPRRGRPPKKVSSNDAAKAGDGGTETVKVARGRGRPRKASPGNKAGAN